MATAPTLHGLALADRRLVERLLDEFEGSWHPGRLREFLPRLPPAEHPLQVVVLREIVKIDLERQWRSGQRVALEHYLSELPDLGGAEEVPASLVLAEYEVVRQAGVPASLDEFARRFPRQSEELRRLVAERSVSSVPLPDRPTPAAGMTDTRPSLGPMLRPAGPSAAPADLPERIGRYRILRKLGQGGMGAVHLAHDEQLDRKVALKIPHTGGAGAAEWRERFQREARAAATLRHPNICPVYDVGEIGGVQLLAMAYIEGRPLSEYIAAAGGKLPDKQVAGVVRKLAMALDEAHGQGIVHRDLKPSNIMIDQRREPIIMDFGLAWRAGADDVRLTHSGAILGTPAYMSPEQVLGQVERIGPACDVYSLGVILYELLTGRLPFEGPAAAVLGQIIAVEPEGVEKLRPDIDPALAEICRRAMGKNIDDRYGSMREMAAALVEYLNRPSQAATAAAEAEPSQATPRPAPQPERTGGPALGPTASIAQTANRPIPIGPSGQAPIVVTTQVSSGIPSVARCARARASWWSKLTSTHKAAVVGCAALPLLLLGAVIFVVTNKGTIKIELSDPTADVTVKVDGDMVEVTALGESLRLRAGEHDLEVTGEGFQTVSRLFTVRRGENPVYTIQLEPAEGAPALAQGNLVADRQAAELVTGKLNGLVRISIGGEIQEVPASGVLPKRDFELINIDLYDHNEVTDDDIAQFVGLKSLQTLSLGGTRLTDRGMESLQGLTSLTNLDISFTGVTDHGMRCLENLTRMQELRAYILPITDAGLVHLSKMSELRFLEIRNTAVGDEGMKLVAQLKSLETLWIGGTGVTDEGLTTIVSLPRLRDLSVGDNRFTDEGLRAVGRMLQLEELYVNSSPLNDQNLPLLFPLKKLKYINIRLTGVTHAGLVRLQAALPGCRIETTLDQTAPPAEPTAQPTEADVSPDRHAAEWALGKPGSTITIRQAAGSQEVEDLAQLPAEAFTVQAIHFPIFRDYNIVDADLVHLKGLAGLETLELANSAALTGTGLVYVAELKSLRDLSLWGSQVGDVGLEHIKDLTNLTRLVLSGHNTDRGLEYLAGLTRLKYLHFALNGNVTDAGVAHLRGLTELEELDLGGAGQLTDAGLEHVKGLTKLHNLQLWNTQVGDAGLEHLKNLVNLRTLNIGGTQVTDAGLEHLYGLTKLEGLDLRNTTVTAAGANALRTALPGCSIDYQERPAPPPPAPADGAQAPVPITNSVGMTFVLIDPPSTPDGGRCLMGSPADEPGRDGVPRHLPAHENDNAVPAGDQERQHPVRLTRPYYLAVTEVTQAQWETVMGKRADGTRPGATPDCPVGVIGHLVEDFLRGLSDLPDEKAAGRVYRLPTEAEWEYACRAGTTTAYHFGDDGAQLGEFDWHDQNADRPQPVAQKKPNPWGLFDMHGNVREWCVDLYELYPNDEQLDPVAGAALAMNDAGSDRVVRGGSYATPPGRCRSAWRMRHDTRTLFFEGIGIRAALTADDQAAQGALAPPADVPPPGPAQGGRARLSLKAELERLRKDVARASVVSRKNDAPAAAALLRRISSFVREHLGTVESEQAAVLMAQLTWPVDLLQREEIDPGELATAGGGSSLQVPAALVAVFGNGQPLAPKGSVAFSPDGQTLAAAGSVQGTVSLWNLSTGEERILNHGATVASVSFSPDGRFFGVAGGTAPAKLWNAATGDAVGEFSGHQGEIHSLGFSPDGNMLATTGNDKHVELWEVESGRRLSVLAEGPDGLGAVSFSPDGRFVAAGTFSHTVQCWDVRTGALRTTKQENGGWIHSVAFSPDGLSFAGGGDDHRVRIWDVATLVQQRELRHVNNVDSVAFSPTGGMLAATASPNNRGTIEIWDWPGGDTRMTLPLGVPLRQVAFSPEGRHVAASSDSGAVYVFRVAELPAE